MPLWSRDYGLWAGVQVALRAMVLVVAGGVGTMHLRGAEPELKVPDGTKAGEPAAAELKAKPGIWDDEVGNGFRAGLQTLGVTLGAAYGLAAFGGHESHDLALANLEYGRMIGPPLGHSYGLRGNFEVRAELFAGAEFSPSKEWLVGLTPHLRYNFATGSRWVPFFDIGAGVSATSIGPPDLSGTFEFNLQAGMGVHRFIRDNLALTLEGHYLHMSCAGIHDPNAGLNAIMGMVGLTWFF